MGVSERRKAKQPALRFWLAGLGILGVVLAAMVPFIASHLPIHTSPADDIGFLLLMVGLIAVAIDRRR